MSSSVVVWPTSSGSTVVQPTESGSSVVGLPSTGPVTIVSTTFNEGASFSAIVGTSPATNVNGHLWQTWQGETDLLFNPGGGAIAGAGAGEVLNTGASSYTVTFSGLTNTATQFVSFSISDATLANRIDVQLLGAGGIALTETIGGTTTTLQTQAVANGATGSVVSVVHGTSITVTAFGQTPMTYTIPSGHGDIGGAFIGIVSSTFGTVFGGLTVTVP